MTAIRFGLSHISCLLLPRFLIGAKRGAGSFWNRLSGLVPLVGESIETAEDDSFAEGPGADFYLGEIEQVHRGVGHDRTGRQLGCAAAGEDRKSVV